jgi:P-type E1-E2 ATPase
MVGTGRGASMGVLVKGGEVLEGSRHAGMVVFDKTGTLTKGEMALTDLRAAPGEEPNRLLGLAGAAEAYSEHPIGQAIAAAAAQRAVTVPEAGEFAAVAGHGVRAVITGQTVLVGQPKLMAEHGLGLRRPSKRTSRTWRLRGGPRSWSGGTVRSAACWAWRTRSRATPARSSAACAPWGWRWR